MKAKKAIALLSIFMLGMDSTSVIPAVLAAEKTAPDQSEKIVKETEENSYFHLKYNGSEQKVSLPNGAELHLKGWKDEKKEVIIAEYQLLEEEKDPEVTKLEIKVSQEAEAKEYKINSEEVLLIRTDTADAYEWEKVVPVDLAPSQITVAENENGSSIEQEIVTDEWGTILKREEPVFYMTTEKGEKSIISEEEYNTLNEVNEETSETEKENEEEAGKVEDEILEEDESEKKEEADVEKEVESDAETEKEENKESTNESTEAEVSEEKDIVEKKEEEKKEEAEIQSFQAKAAAPSIIYSTHIQTYGWSTNSKNGKTSGTEGEKKRLESIKIQTTGIDGLGVTYSTHVQSSGWTPFVSNGNESGTVGKAKRLEAIKISLTGTQSAKYDVYYRVHAETYGWLDWAKNGEPAGTSSLAKRLEAIQIVLVKKGAAAPGKTNRPYVEGPSNDNPNPSVTPLVSYQAYVEGVGWQSPVSNGEPAGTQGSRKKIEAIRMNIQNIAGLGIEYSTHMQSAGWMNWQSGPSVSGTAGSGKRMEALKIKLTGNMASNYDVFYRVHSQTLGWLGWAKNGEPAGTEGYGYRAEAVEIKVLPKNSGFNQEGTAFQKNDPATIVFSSHVQQKGWLPEVTNGKVTGTTGQALRMEALKVTLKDSQYAGSISYRTHVQSMGWTNEVTNGAIGGTVGKGKRMEAIEIRLTGEIAKHYDIYYRVHAQSYGWLGWAKNGMPAGTEGLAKRLESIEIRLVAKGKEAPNVSEDGAFKKEEKKVIFLDPGHGGSDTGANYYGVNEKTLNIQVAEKVRKNLEAAGFVVIMSRTTDTYVDHKTERSKMANNSGADIFISLHHNAMPNNSNVTGIETFYYEYDPDWPPAINGSMHNDPNRLKQSAALAKAVQSSLISSTGAVDRKVQRETFAVLRETSLPAILVELGFMSNQNELNKLTTDSYQNLLAKSLTNGVLNYYKNK